MAKIAFVTLAVDDLDETLAFYRRWLGLAEDDISSGEDHAALTLEDDFSLVLYPREKIAEAAGRPAMPSASEVILSREAKDEQEFARILAEAEAEAAGGTVPTPSQDGDWGRSGFVLDPDGHLWEIVLFATD